MPTGTWGDPGRAARARRREAGPPAELLERRPVVRSRFGIDRSPIDVTNDDEALLLQSFVWADQTARLERLRRAIEVARHRPAARSCGATTATSCRGSWPSGATDGLTVVFHSVSIAYVRREERSRLAEEIEDAGREGPLAWIAYEFDEEPDRPAFEAAALDVTVWPGGERRRLALARRACEQDAMARVVTAASNPRLKLVRRLESAGQRQRLGLFAAEGEDLVAAALDAGLEPVEALVDASRPVLLDRLPGATLVDGAAHGRDLDAAAPGARDRRLPPGGSPAGDGRAGRARALARPGSRQPRDAHPRRRRARPGVRGALRGLCRSHRAEGAARRDGRDVPRSARRVGRRDRPEDRPRDGRADRDLGRRAAASA